MVAMLATGGCGEDAESRHTSTPDGCEPGAIAGAVPDFPAGEPKCPKGAENLLKLQGVLDGTSISLERTGDKALGGFVNNESGGGFQSLVDTDSAELFVGFNFPAPLAPSVVGNLSGGFFILPTGTPAAGTWYIEEGKLVFPDQPSEGTVKFAFTLVSGADECVRTAALSGCWASL